MTANQREHKSVSNIQHFSIAIFYLRTLHKTSILACFAAFANIDSVDVCKHWKRAHFGLFCSICKHEQHSTFAFYCHFLSTHSAHVSLRDSCEFNPPIQHFSTLFPFSICALCIKRAMNAFANFYSVYICKHFTEIAEQTSNVCICKFL